MCQLISFQVAVIQELNDMVDNTGMADLSDTSRWWFNCVCVSESVCPKTCRHIARRMMNG